MITIQRVRVRWSAAARGAPQANARRGLSRAATLPTAVPPGELVIHDVLAAESAELVGGGLERACDVDLWLAPGDSALVVERLPGRAAYPRHSRATRLFELKPGQIGRYRANFRFRSSSCSCDPSWYYEDWLVHVCNGDLTAGGFLQRDPDHDVDHRVHLYGGPRRSPAGRGPG